MQVPETVYRKRIVFYCKVYLKGHWVEESFDWGELTKGMSRRDRQQKKNLLGDPLRIASTQHENCTNTHSTPSSESMDIIQEDLTTTMIENLRQAMILPLQWTQHTRGIISYYSSVQNYIYGIIFKSAHCHAQAHSE